MLRRALVPILLAFACACAAPAMPEPTPAPPTPPPVPSPVASTHDFDVALYRELARQPGNQFVSPYSLSSAFALLYPGARGTTAAEMSATLGFDPSAAAATARTRNLGRALQSGGQFTLANAAWVDRTFTLDPAYLRVVRDDLGSAIESVDFRRAAPQAVRQINAWAAQATRDRIQNLLSELSSDTVLVLTNAVYFKDDWADQFSANATRDGPFHLASGQTRTARLMRQATHARYFETPEFQAADFDYANRDFSLAVFLPRETSSLARFEGELTGARLTQWLEQVERADAARLDVTLPKVRMESSYQLVDPLRAIGLRQVFTNGSDLSGVSGASLLVSRVVQKTFLQIDEKGTEAAAATAIIVAPTAAPMDPQRPIVFRADRPFFIVLRHRPTNTILFMGRVAEP